MKVEMFLMILVFNTKLVVKKALKEAAKEDLNNFNAVK